uniref:RING-type domain-containing protein n=1 Tax=Chromulina nebulosa TaxID=96789 RepID=A0A7S0SPB3_9STRA|mmetsp:Transcript_1117/g.985  ORF Transcript_1117/g.985 Transcript_1117/m.985 type:complete len:821 (+) Transcript_1117:122-2584(+)
MNQSVKNSINRGSINQSTRNNMCSPCENIKKHSCIVCLDTFEDVDANEGVICSNDHLICLNDLRKYVVENVFTQIHKLRENRCAIYCPCNDCSSQYNLLDIFERLESRDKLRLISLIYDLVFPNEPNVKALKDAILDMMTLKCPTCKIPVDPMPDACSAILCIGCGSHYCNYCFVGFSSGNQDEDKRSSHLHVATHSTSTSPEGRDSFLSAELIAIGHKECRRYQLMKCLSIAMRSKDLTKNSNHLVIVALTTCHQEIADMGLDISTVYNDTLVRIEASESRSLEDTMSTFTEIDDKFVDPNGNTQFVFRQSGPQLANAIITCNSQAFLQLISSYRDTIDLNYIEGRYGHPLASLAILSDQAWAAKILLEKGASPFVLNGLGRNVLYIIIEAGKIELLELVIQKYPDFNLNDELTTEIQKYNAIHVAARNNQGHMIKALVQAGCDIDAVEGEHGYTPLMLAMVLGYEWVVAELIYNGANFRFVARNGRTPLFIAAEKGYISSLCLMLNYGKFDINGPVVTPSGLRLIHVASYHNQPHIVKKLIDLKADVNIRSDEQGGYTPLVMALLGMNTSAAIDLIKAGADITEPSKSGRSPLFLAIEKGLTEVVKYLICDCKVNVNSPVTTETSASCPLHVAILYGQSHFIPLLISLGALVNTPDRERKCTPLHIAVLLNDKWSTLQLLEHGADSTLLTRERRNAMHIAAEKGYSGILRILIEYSKSPPVNINASVTNESHHGNALHVACMFNHPHTVIELLNLGADVFVLDSKGRTPLDVAKEFSSGNCENVLVQYIERNTKNNEKINNHIDKRSRVMDIDNDQSK